MAAVAFTACNNEESLLIETGNHTITASMESDTPETRTAFEDESGVLYWIKGDDIAVLNSGGSFTQYTLSAGNGTANATFTAKAKIGTNSTYALHPYSSHNYDSDEAKLTFNLPVSYSYTESSDDYGVAPMLAQTEETDATSYYFEHLGGAFCFTINNLPATTTYFKFEADEQITGDFEVEENTDGKLEISLPEEASVSSEAYSVTITFPTESAASNKRFFIPLPVGTYEGFTISIGTDSEETWTYTSTASNEIVRTRLVKMPEVTLNATVDGTVVTEVATADALKAAIAAGSSVKLTDNFTVDNSNADYLLVSKDLTIDLNGKTLTFTSKNDYPAIKNTASLTITNGTIAASQHGIQNNGTLNINCTIQSGGSAIYTVYDGETTIEGGTYTSTSTSYALIACDSYTSGGSNTPVTNINGGTFTSPFTNVSYNNYSSGHIAAGTFNCTGGWHNVYAGGSEGGCTVTYDSNACSFTVTSGATSLFALSENTVNSNSITATVATVDALQAAIAAGGSVKLTDNFTVDNSNADYLLVSKDLTIDLNGKTLTFTSKDDYPAIKNTASLTITNGTIAASQHGIQNNGTLNINCTIQSGGSAIYTVYDGETTIEGGTYTSTSTSYALIACDSYTSGGSNTPVTNINGGTFTSPFTNVSYNNYSSGHIAAGTFNCTGGWHNVYAGGSEGGCTVTYDSNACSFTVTSGATSLNAISGSSITAMTDNSN